jgi:DNA polymerase delta subunit 1
MMKRDAASAPSVGDRVAFVMIKGARGAKGFEKSEDPLFVLENNLPLDYNHYLEHQLKLPLIRIFEPILQSPENVLFVGDHTRNIYVPKVTNAGLGRFTVVKKACLSCKRVVDRAQALCAACKPKEKQIYVERRLEQSRFEKNYSDLWVQCQRCQGSLHDEILCQSRDCPIFYRRVKAAKNLKEAREVL